MRDEEVIFEYFFRPLEFLAFEGLGEAKIRAYEIAELLTGRALDERVQDHEQPWVVVVLVSDGYRRVLLHVEADEEVDERLEAWSGGHVCGALHFPKVETEVGEGETKWGLCGRFGYAQNRTPSFFNKKKWGLPPRRGGALHFKRAAGSFREHSGPFGTRKR